MIASLSGTIKQKDLYSLILELQGIGYEVIATQHDLDAVTIGQNQTLYIYENIREDTHDLYGFLDQSAKRLFVQLLNVSGVGPKMALSIMGLGTKETVASAIARGDSAYIATAPGVGKRIAERIIVDLQDKVGAPLAASEKSSKDEAFQALLALGYDSKQASLALHNVPGSMPTEERLKMALKELG